MYHANCGACNGCDIEVINVLTPYYDAERFGIKLVGSPRHADVILISGPVTRQVEPALKRLVEAVPNPKLTFAIGSCATGGGCWFDTYNVMGGADKVTPVDYYIPGCPPTTGSHTLRGGGGIGVGAEESCGGKAPPGDPRGTGVRSIPIQGQVCLQRTSLIQTGNQVSRLNSTGGEPWRLKP